MNRIARHVVTRLAAGVLVIWCAATLSFAAMTLIPGDPVDTLLGGSVSASPALRRQIVEAFGFDEPIPVRYAKFLGRLLSTDLGESYRLQAPVGQLIGEQLPSTASLAALSALLAIVLAVVAVLTTAGHDTVARRMVSALELVLASTPSYWLGILLLTFFAHSLHIFPVAGDWGLASLVLPAVTLALPMAAILARVLREGFEDVLALPFVVSVKARGVTETALRLRHVLRHALAPTVTLTGWMLGTLLGGAAVVETVFARQGIGRLAVTAVESRDMPVVTGVVLLTAGVFVVINLVVDLLYVIIDTRLRDA